MLTSVRLNNIITYNIKRYSRDGSYRYKSVMYMIYRYSNGLYLVRHQGTAFNHKSKHALVAAIKQWEPTALYAVNKLSNGIYNSDELLKLIPELDEYLSKYEEV